MSAYRSPGGVSETIVIPVERSTWWTLAFALPLPLVFNRAFMNLVVPLPKESPYADYFGPPPTLDDLHRAQSIRETIMIAAGVVAFCGVFVALTSLARAKNVVVIDRRARVVRIQTKKGAWEVAFDQCPTLVERDGTYFLDSGAFKPLMIASSSSPRAAIHRLQAALATLSEAMPG